MHTVEINIIFQPEIENLQSPCFNFATLRMIKKAHVGLFCFLLQLLLSR